MSNFAVVSANTVVPFALIWRGPLVIGVVVSSQIGDGLIFLGQRPILTIDHSSFTRNMLVCI
jgi:hypothetical protein